MTEIKETIEDLPKHKNNMEDTIEDLPKHTNSMEDTIGPLNQYTTDLNLLESTKISIMMIHVIIMTISIMKDHILF